MLHHSVRSENVTTKFQPNLLSLTLASYPLTTSLFSERQPQIPDLFLNKQRDGVRPEGTEVICIMVM